MSNEITEHFVQQYSANVFHLAQQKGSRLRRTVRNESQRGKAAFYDRLGSTAAVKKTSRHSDTPLVESAHSRRMVTLEDYEWSDLIDDQDKLRMLNDPQSIYAQAAMYAHGRSMDDEIIAAASGNAYSGESGGTSVALPNSQKIGATTGAAVSGLNVFTLRKVGKIFDDNDVDEMEQRFFIFDSNGKDDLLGETEVTSADYNNVRALVQGEVNTFLGMEFIRSQRLGSQSGTLNYELASGAVGSGSGDADGHKKGLAYAKSGLLLAIGDDIKSRIDERSDKSYSTQVYCKMSIGATRLEEEKVVECLYDV